LIQAGKDLIINIIQISMGGVLAIIFLGLFKGRLEKFQTSPVKNNIFALGIIILGTLLPLDTFGILPLFAAMIAAGVGYNKAVAFLVANAFFNMTVPYTDIAFTWKYGVLRPILAIVVGSLACFILYILKKQDFEVLRKNNVSILFKEFQGGIGFIKCIGNGINLFAPYLLVGVLANTVFKNYVLNNVLDLIFKSKATSFIPNAFSSLNVTNVFFLLVLNIAVMLMNFIKLSAFIAALKIRGVLVYYACYMGVALVLSVSIFM
jgi:uncharacterized membrane protein YraQ (UPF0718 family)